MLYQDMIWAAYNWKVACTDALVTLVVCGFPVEEATVLNRIFVLCNGVINGIVEFILQQQQQ